MVLLGGCCVTIFPLSISLISRHFPNEQVGAAVGSYESAMGVGATIGLIFAGTVAAISNIRLSFVSASFIGILMMIIVQQEGAFRELEYRVSESRLSSLVIIEF